MSPQSELSSRERILCTLLHKELDHVPLWNLWLKLLEIIYRWQKPRIELLLEEKVDLILLAETKLPLPVSS